ncbi:MAG: Clp protease N-terminal domain-containing protein [Stackebrandtia sp.]
MNEYSPELPVRLDDLITYVNKNRADGDALERLSDACWLAEALEDQADHLIGHFVDQARRSGASWTDIGQHMGISKQAAQKRFVTDAGKEFDLQELLGKNARFTHRAKVVLAKAELAARNAGNDRVDSLHLLLGLVEEPNSIACRALNTLDVALDDLAQAATTALPPRNPEPISATDDLPLSKDGRKALQLSVRFALHHGHNYIGTEHMLLGILTTDGPGATLLIDRGLTRKAAVKQVLAELENWKRKRQTT